MNKIKMIIRLLLSNRVALITSTDDDNYPWLVTTYHMDDAELNTCCQGIREGV